MSLPAASPWKISFVTVEKINRYIENIWSLCSFNAWHRVNAKFSLSFFKLRKVGEFCVFTSQLCVPKAMGGCWALVQGELQSPQRTLCAWDWPGWLGQTFLARALCVLTSCFCTGEALSDGFPHPRAPALRAAFLPRTPTCLRLVRAVFNHSMSPSELWFCGCSAMETFRWGERLF